MNTKVKNIAIITIILFILFSIMPKTMAVSSYTATFTPQVDSTVQQGKSIIFDVAVTGFTDVGQGINSFYAIIDYDESIFEDIIVDGYTKSVWSNPTFNKETNKMVTESNTFINTTSRVLTVELVTRDDAPLGDTIVRLTNITTSGGSQDIKTADREVTVTVKEPKTITPDPNPDNPDDVPEVDDNKRVIKKLSPYTTVDEFKDMFSNYTVQVYNKSDQLVSDGEYIATEMKAVIDGETYVLVVRGDLNGDGRLTTTDLSKMKAHIVGTIILTTFFEMAADINDDNAVTVTDLSRLKLALAGLITL